MKTLIKTLESNESWINTSKLIKRFRPKADWQDLDLDFIKNFRDWMLKKAKKKDESSYSINTFSLHYGYIKSAIRYSMRNGNSQANEKCFGLRVSKERKNEVYLTESELLIIESMDLKGKYDTVRKMFLTGAYSGARISDFRRMSRKNMDGDKLRYMTQKTGVNVVVKLHPYVQSILRSGLGDFGGVSEATERKYVNDYIKVICKKAGICQDVLISQKIKGKVVDVLKPKYALVTSHTARKSYATNMILSGKPMVAVQKFLGHSDIKMTSKYVICDGEEFLD